MPNAAGQYLGSYAGVLPDNSAAILHMADQYAQFNRYKEQKKLLKAASDAKRSEDYYKLVGENFDQTKSNDLNPYHNHTINDITQTQQRYMQLISSANKAGKPIDEGQLRASMVQDMNRIKINDDLAKQKTQEIKEAVDAIKKEPGIDHEKLLGLAMNDYFNTSDPATGKVGMNPQRWNKNLTGADVVKQTLEKYPAIVGNNEGVDDALAEKMKSAQPAIYKVPAVLDRNGQEISPSADVNLKPYQQVVYKNGVPAKLDIRQEPVLLPNGKPLLNLDGSQKTTIAKDLEKEALSHLGFALNVKRELNEEIGAENQRRRAINDNLVKQGLAPTLQMVTGDSEEAKVMNSDIVLKKLRSVMQGGGIDVKESKDFENRLKVQSANRDQRRLGIMEEHLKLSKDKAAKGDLTPPTDDFLADVDNTYGQDVEVEDKSGTPGKKHWFKKDEPGVPATYTTKRIIPETADPKDIDIVAGKKNASTGKRPVEAKKFTRKDGTTIKGWEYDPRTGNAIGAGGVEINNTAVQREYLNHLKKGVAKELQKETKPKIQGMFDNL